MQRNQKQDSINFDQSRRSTQCSSFWSQSFNSCATLAGGCSNQIWNCTKFGWKFEHVPIFFRDTIQDPPICLRFLWPSRWSYMVGWGWSGTSTSTLWTTSKEFLEGFRSVWCCRLCGTPSKWNAADLNCSHLADTLTVRSQTQSYNGNQLSVALGSLSHNATAASYLCCSCLRLKLS